MSSQIIASPVLDQNTGVQKMHQETQHHYDHYHFIEGGEHRVRWWMDYLEEYLPESLVKGKLMADIGCSVGEITKGLVRRGARMVCLDLSLQSLKRCREINKEPVLFNGTAIDQPFADETFDHAMSIGVLMITPDCRKGFKEVARITKPGGTIVLFIYSKWNWFNLAYKVSWPLRAFVPLASVPSWFVRMMQPFAKQHLGQELNEEQLRRLWGDKLWTPHATFHSVRELIKWGKEEGMEPVAWKKFYLGYANTIRFRKKGTADPNANSQLKLRCLKCGNQPLQEENQAYPCKKCGSSYVNEGGIFRFRAGT